MTILWSGDNKSFRGWLKVVDRYFGDKPAKWLVENVAIDGIAWYNNKLERATSR